MKNCEEYLAPVINKIPPSGIRKFFDLVMNAEGVISLGVGEPDFVTPWHIREACTEALAQGYTMYTSNQGLPELRQEIAAYLKKSLDLKYCPEKEILVTVGASEAVDLAMRSLIAPGDEVLIPEPCYVSYKPCAYLAGGEPVSIQTSAVNKFKLTSGLLEKHLTSRSKILVLSYPNNPTGAVMRRKELEEIARVVIENDLIVISDEIYGELTYNGSHVSIASLPQMQSRTILINGLSKAYAMTGWRIGYIAAAPAFVSAMVKIHQYTMLCAPVMSQMAALEAFRNGKDDVKQMRGQYDQRRRLVVTRLREMGLDCFEPEGAFYVFPSIKKTGLSSQEFTEELLKKEKVAVVSGEVFGRGGEGHIRCSYAASVTNLTEALQRMENFVRNLSRGLNCRGLKEKAR